MRRARLSSVCLILLIIAGACSQKHGSRQSIDAPPASPAPSAAEAAELSVLSFNIRYGTARDGDDHWNHRRALVIETIARHDADIVGLQEALAFQLDELLDALPQYTAVGAGRDDGRRAGEYCAVLFNRRLTTHSTGNSPSSGTFWFSDTPDVPGSKHWGNSITRICTWARLRAGDHGPEFYVFNVHLDHQSEPSRRRSAQFLAQRIGSRGDRAPVIVTGDFNAGESSEALAILRGQRKPPPGFDALTDTFRAVHPHESKVRTFHAFKGEADTTGRGGPSGALTEKIDFVLVGPGIETIDATIDRWNLHGRYPSDHYPVAAKVRLLTLRAEQTSPSTPPPP